MSAALRRRAWLLELPLAALALAVGVPPWLGLASGLPPVDWAVPGSLQLLGDFGLRTTVYLSGFLVAFSVIELVALVRGRPLLDTADPSLPPDAPPGVLGSPPGPVPSAAGPSREPANASTPAAAEGSSRKHANAESASPAEGPFHEHEETGPTDQSEGSTQERVGADRSSHPSFGAAGPRTGSDGPVSLVEPFYGFLPESVQRRIAQHSGYNALLYTKVSILFSAGIGVLLAGSWEPAGPFAVFTRRDAVRIAAGLYLVAESVHRYLRFARQEPSGSLVGTLLYAATAPLHRPPGSSGAASD